jgi:hypothetical protein
VSNPHNEEQPIIDHLERSHGDEEYDDFDLLDGQVDWSRDED